VTLTDAHNQVPRVAADQFTLDRTLKHLRKLRWIGNEREAQRILRTLSDIRLQPSLSDDKTKMSHTG
jgi:hypothetical protein